MKIKEITFENNEEAFIHITHGYRAYLNNGKYITRNNSTSKFHAINIEGNEYTAEVFNNKDVAMAWLDGKLEIDKTNELLKEYNKYTMREYGEGEALETINSIQDSLIGIAYSTTTDYDDVMEYEVQISYDLVNQREINEMYNYNIFATYYIDSTIDDYIESLQTNDFNAHYSYIHELISPSDLTQYVLNRKSKLDNMELNEEFRNNGIQVKLPYEIEVTQTVKKVYTEFAESEDNAIENVKNGLPNSYILLQEGNTNLSTEVSIFNSEIEESLELDM